MEICPPFFLLPLIPDPTPSSSRPILIYLIGSLASATILFALGLGGGLAMLGSPFGEDQSNQGVLTTTMFFGITILILAAPPAFVAGEHVVQAVLLTSFRKPVKIAAELMIAALSLIGFLISLFYLVNPGDVEPPQAFHDDDDANGNNYTGSGDPMLMAVGIMLMVGFAFLFTAACNAAIEVLRKFLPVKWAPPRPARLALLLVLLFLLGWVPCWCLACALLLDNDHRLIFRLCSCGSIVHH
eukprot:m.102271 g.102271  ORF g.102271 m.102271 type:complete len:242 (+) comp8819_c0_seq4:685-1410(+)